MKSLKVYLTFFLAFTMLFSACNSSKNTMPTGGDSTYQNQPQKKGMSKTAKGGLIGAGGGAILGGVICAISGNTAAGALIGAAVGGTTGAIIGRRMDKQAAELQRDMQPHIAFDAALARQYFFFVTKAGARFIHNRFLNHLHP